MSEQLISQYEKQFDDSIDAYDEPDAKCTYGAGMLLILSAMK
jgi:hypothetical protein